MERLRKFSRPLPGEFDQECRAIRNRIREYDAGSVVRQCVQLLHHPDLQPTRGVPRLLGTYEPWNLLFLIEQVLLHGDLISGRHPEINQQRFNSLINRVKNLRRFECPLDFDHVFLFFKNLAFEQFWYQRTLDRAALSRPIVLFSTLPAHSRFDDAFRSEFGLSLETYFDLSFALAARFLQDRASSVVTLQYFSPGFAAYGETSFRTLLDGLALTPFEARRHVEAAGQIIRNPMLRLYAPSPLREYPFLKLSDGYLCYSPVVLQQRLADFVYDVLARTASQEIRRLFGIAFESYVGRTLSALSRKILVEGDLQRAAGLQTKAVDFVLPYANASVLIEAKGVELTPFARVSTDASVIARSLKGSVIKGINQAGATVGLLDSLRRTGRSVTPDGPYYCMIVTYRRMYLNTAKEVIAKLTDDERAKLLPDYLAYAHLLPLEHIYLVPVEDLEHAIALEVHGDTTLAEVLERSVIEDGDPRTQCFELGLRLDKIDSGVRYPQHLTEAFDNLAERVQARFEFGRRRHAVVQQEGGTPNPAGGQLL